MLRVDGLREKLVNAMPYQRRCMPTMAQCRPPAHDLVGLIASVKFLLIGPADLIPHVRL